MRDSKDLEIIELRGRVNDLIARCEALELQNSAILKSQSPFIVHINNEGRTKESYGINLIKAAWFPILAGFIRLAYKFLYRVKK